MSRFVLCKFHRGTGVNLFVTNADPETPCPNRSLDRAVSFVSVESALAHRVRMPWMLGGTEQFRVKEVLPDGSLIDSEGDPAATGPSGSRRWLVILFVVLFAAVILLTWLLTPRPGG